MAEQGGVALAVTSVGADGPWSLSATVTGGSTDLAINLDGPGESAARFVGGANGEVTAVGRQIRWQAGAGQG